MESEAFRRGVGGHDGQPCICTRDCPAACGGDRCGCEACSRAWIDSGLDVLIGTTLRGPTGIKQSCDDL
jgi:hypothetical protein